MMGEGTFTKENYDEILAELQQHWWPVSLYAMTEANCKIFDVLSLRQQKFMSARTILG